MEWLKFMFLVVAVSRVSGSKLWASRLTGEALHSGSKYTVRYTAPTEAVVLWGSEDTSLYFQNDTNVQIRSSFSDGQGESSLIHRALTQGASVSLASNESVTTYTFTHFDGERNLSEVNLDSSNGTEWVYTPNEPFTIRLQYSHLSVDYINLGLDAYFHYIDNRDEPTIKLAGSPFGDFNSFISNVRTVNKGNFTETSEDLTLSSFEGILLVTTNYRSMSLNMRIITGRYFEIKQAGHVGPFPDNFLGLLKWRISPLVYCINGMCRHACQAYGQDIVEVELRKAGSDVVIEPLCQIKDTWFTATHYQFPSWSGDLRKVVCTATNKHNQTVQEEYGLMDIENLI